MGKIEDFYYGLWSQISDWPQFSRVALVIAVLVLVTWIAVVLIFPKIIKIFLAVLQKAVKIFYVILSDCIFRIIFRKNYIQVANKCSSLMERCFLSINKIKGKFGKKLHIGKFILLYLIVTLLVSLPDMLNSVVNKEYIDMISAVSNIYNKFENEQLQIASTYKPIIIESKGEDKITEEPSLEQKQIIKDVNFREGPGTSYPSLKVLKKGTRVLFIEYSEDKKWCHVIVDNDVDGWVHHNYIK